VVRRPAAVLTGVYAATLAYLLIASALPAISGTDAAVLAASLPGLALLGACVAAAGPVSDGMLPLLLFAAGGAMLGAALTEAGADAGASLFKALFAAGTGLAAARLLATPAVAVAVPVFVAGIGIAATLGSSAPPLLHGETPESDLLVCVIPAWGGGTAGYLSLIDLLFLAFFAGCAWRLALRREATALALVAALPAALAVSVAAGQAVSALPFLALALVVPNAGLLPGLLRAERDE
jgi:hypothetical protein